ncbi:hypothetical protein [Nocardioides pakistanensis]
MTTDSTTPAEIARAFGVEFEQPTWEVPADPVDPTRFGKDHYSSLLYVEVRAVDHKGFLAHDHMRCDGKRHPFLLNAKRRSIAFGTEQADAHGKYPTRLRRNADGTVDELPDHDDYDCLGDMVACGWLIVQMPQPDFERDVFVDAKGSTVAPDGDPIRPSFFTGMDEALMAAHAKWGLTDLGHTVAAALRKHQADGGTLSTFEPPVEVV